jgi:hypothetical protein
MRSAPQACPPQMVVPGVRPRPGPPGTGDVPCCRATRLWPPRPRRGGGRPSGGAAPRLRTRRGSRLCRWKPKRPRAGCAEGARRRCPCPAGRPPAGRRPTRCRRYALRHPSPAGRRPGKTRRLAAAGRCRPARQSGRGRGGRPRRCRESGAPCSFHRDLGTDGAPVEEPGQRIATGVVCGLRARPSTSPTRHRSTAAPATSSS